MMRRASCCVQEASGGADQPDQQLDCVLVSKTLSAYERLPGGQIQTVRLDFIAKFASIVLTFWPACEE
jgi:hypothetical protein